MTVERLFSNNLGPSVLVHGGAGDVPGPRRADHIEGCRAASRAGYAVLVAGGTALDAVQAAARVLEDLPQFNAGTGAALNVEGGVEHDAAVMEGRGLRAGAVAALRGMKNPIDVARAVLDEGRHVLLAGEGAGRFAIERGFEAVDEATLVTERARLALERVLANAAPKGWAGGTIGAVARDGRGGVAAATSTGGTIGKRPGRVGDSPILGAGTIADDGACAASATGDGEAILKVGLARLVATWIETAVRPDLAAIQGLERMLARTTATGGLIVIVPSGEATAVRSTQTMSWAITGERGEEAGI